MEECFTALAVFWPELRLSRAKHCGGPSELGWHDRHFRLAQRRHDLMIKLQMRIHELRWRQRHPRVKRQIGEVAALEDLQKAQRRRAGILDVMTHGEGHVTDVAGLEIEGARLTGSAEHTHARL